MDVDERWRGDDSGDDNADDSAAPAAPCDARLAPQFVGGMAGLRASGGHRRGISRALGAAGESGAINTAKQEDSAEAALATPTPGPAATGDTGSPPPPHSQDVHRQNAV